jgi:hypothetical protein
MKHEFVPSDEDEFTCQECPKSYNEHLFAEVLGVTDEDEKFGDDFDPTPYVFSDGW